MADLITTRARECPDAPAFTYVPERDSERVALTYAQIEARSQAVAVRLLEHAQPGDRALLLFPPGLDCIVAFFACLLVEGPVMRLERLSPATAPSALDSFSSLELSPPPSSSSALERPPSSSSLSSSSKD